MKFIWNFAKASFIFADALIIDSILSSIQAIPLTQERKRSQDCLTQTRATIKLVF
jgi:hypothetical protein